nr:hypothetical protein [Tanacetum cinerariifolium]
FFALSGRPRAGGRPASGHAAAHAAHAGGVHFGIASLWPAVPRQRPARPGLGLVQVLLHQTDSADGGSIVDTRTPPAAAARTTPGDVGRSRDAARLQTAGC